MRPDELIELFGDTVTQLTGNPYTGKQLSTEDLERIKSKFDTAIWDEILRTAHDSATGHK